MKETGTATEESNTAATNSSGFRSSEGIVTPMVRSATIGYYGNWWSSTEFIL
jgi:hypothetical protein